MKLRYLNLFLLFAFIFTKQIFAQSPDFKTLANWLSGSFSNEEQAKQDSDYFHITLRMVPVWKNSKDGIWLYVEQAVAQKQDKPYRQRVYHLTEKDGKTFESEVYTFKGDPLRFAGEWKKTEPLAKLSPDSLETRSGCSIILTKKGETFVGSTQGKNCESNLKGAAYATSEVTLFKDKIISWDRGFDKKNEQVWGAEKGGYIFKKIKE
ncbi:chromophore lyase CpcT/CpeT [bacterium]|nr:chromophore lyase CpcT/CpeT [bacterium]